MDRITLFPTNAEYLTFQKIVDAEYELPEGLSEPAADLIRRLLQVDPVQRIGEPCTCTICACRGVVCVAAARLTCRPLPVLAATKLTRRLLHVPLPVHPQVQQT